MCRKYDCEQTFDVQADSDSLLSDDVLELSELDSLSDGLLAGRG